MIFDVTFEESEQTFNVTFKEVEIIGNTRPVVIEPLEIIENGEYYAENIDGFNPVKVNVPLKYEEGYKDGFQSSQDSIILQEKTATSNGEVTADEGFTGLSKVNVSVLQKEEQEKNVDVTENGTFEVTPDEGYALSKVTANVNVPVPEGYIKPSGTLEVTENGTHDVTEYQSVNVNISTAGGGGDPTLPGGYVRCGYIQFDGEQIVDTDIVCNQNTEMKFAFTREKSSQHYMYGVASSDSTASVTAYLGGSWRFGNKSQTKSITTNEDMIYGGVVSNSEITITNSKTTISGVNDFETIGSLLLGSCRNADGTIPSATFVGKILFFSIWQGDIEVLHLSPVVSTDGVYRFYDEVSGNFFDSITDTPLDGGNL